MMNLAKRMTNRYAIKKVVRAVANRTWKAERVSVN
jgi:hypothetical protein